MNRNLRTDAEDEGGIDFRADLLAVDGDLHMEDINAMKFMIKDFAPTNKLENITVGHELFCYLEKAGTLSENKKMLLAEMLKLIQRLDLVDTLKVDETELDKYLARNGSHFTPFRLLLLKLSDDIGDEDLQKLMFTLNIPRARREKIKTALDFFIFLEQAKQINPENVDFLEENMQQISRCDLSQMVKDYKQVVLSKSQTSSTQNVSQSCSSGGDSKMRTQPPLTGLQVQFTSQPKPSVAPPQIPSQPPQLPDLVIPDPLIRDITLRMTDQQFSSLGLQLDRPIDYLQRLYQRFTGPQERSFNLIKDWLLMNQNLGINETVRTLSAAMKISKMTDIANRLEEMYGVATVPDVSIRRNRSQLAEHEQRRVRQEDAQLSRVVDQLEQIDVDQDPVPYYKMDAIPRGICLIINNRDFYRDPQDPQSKEMPQREGTDIDAERLKNTFLKLQFDVRCFENLRDTDLARLSCETALLDHTAFDCFVCCILSHGAEGKIYGSNGRLLNITDITGPYKTQSCPSLAAKPKLFFIQACQGREKQTGREMQTDSEAVEVDAPPKEVIPNEADFLFGYATVAGYVSYRSKTHGSWYITKLTEALNKYAKKEDILSLLLLVNNEVSKANANMDGGRYKQSPAPLYTLRKKLIFQ